MKTRINHGLLEIMGQRVAYQRKFRFVSVYVEKNLKEEVVR